MNNIAENLDKAIVLDIYKKDAVVGVWTKERKISMSQQSTLRKVAEHYGCSQIRVRIDNTEITLDHKHKMFHSQDEIRAFLQNIPEDIRFFLYAHDSKSYPAEDNLFVKINVAWLKFRADYSMVERPPSTIVGSLEIIPSETQDLILVDWRDEHMLYPQYHYNIKTSDIELIDESDITAELL